MTTKQEVFDRLLKMYEDAEEAVIYEYSTGIKRDLKRLNTTVENLAKEYKEAEE